MSKKLDLLGQRFGRLVVVESAPSKKNVKVGKLKLFGNVNAIVAICVMSQHKNFVAVTLYLVVVTLLNKWLIAQLNIT